MVRRALHVLTGLLILALLAVALLPLVGRETNRWRVVSVITGSMEPLLERGDAAVLTPKPTDELKVGDVLVFNPPGRYGRMPQATIHRVVEIVPSARIDPAQVREGTVYVRTKGDHNEDPDPWTAAISDDKVWTLQSVVPYAGRVTIVMADHRTRIGLFIGAGVLLGAYGAYMLRGARRPREPHTLIVIAAAGGMLLLPASSARGAVVDLETARVTVRSADVTIQVNAPATLPGLDLLPGEQRNVNVDVTNAGTIPLSALQLDITHPGPLLVQGRSCAQAWQGNTCPSGTTLLWSSSPAQGRYNLPNLPVRGVTHLNLEVLLPATAPLATQGQSWPLTLTATGVQRKGTVR